MNLQSNTWGCSPRFSIFQDADLGLPGNQKKKKQEKNIFGGWNSTRMVPLHCMAGNRSGGILFTVVTEDIVAVGHTLQESMYDRRFPANVECI